jgi:murein DD-endopeptidase MepM/ murein hydrolase activator NlpD
MNLLISRFPIRFSGVLVWLFGLGFPSLVHAQSAQPTVVTTVTAVVVVVYQPPVAGPVTDGWRPPAGPYGAGNRGIDYQTAVGQVVGATGAGSVSFAGSVAGNRWVVIRHADGRRSSLGPLGVIFVAVGQPVDGGQQVGTASQAAIHWGVREESTYIDPGTLLPGPKGKIRLTK